MFCPICKAEYREGFTTCKECNVALVGTLPADQDAREQDLAVAWRGTDPSAFSAALAALQGADIPSYQISDHDQLAFELAIPRPQYRLLVRKTDLPAALALVAPFGERAALAHARDILKGRNEFQDTEQEDSDGTSLQAASPIENAPDDIVGEFNSKDASAEVWTGEDTQMKEMLLACLRENGIGSVVDPAGGQSRIRVLPASAARAREIIREVVEASPPV